MVILTRGWRITNKNHPTDYQRHLESQTNNKQIFFINHETFTKTKKEKNITIFREKQRVSLGKGIQLGRPKKTEVNCNKRREKKTY